jgi:hypothetical protein
MKINHPEDLFRLPRKSVERALCEGLLNFRGFHPFKDDPGQQVDWDRPVRRDATATA